MTIIMHMVLLVYWEDLSIIWAIAGGFAILVSIVAPKRSLKKFFYAILIAVLLPLIIVLVILWLPFAFLKKKDKKVIKRILHHPEEGEEGHPATIIKKYLSTTKHEKLK